MYDLERATISLLSDASPDPAALRSTASLLQSIAHDLRTRADIIEKQASARERFARERLQWADLAARRYDETGDIDRAADLVRRDAGVPVETARYYVEQYATRVGRFRRERRIFELARDGQSNSAIALAVGCSPSTVSRTLRRRLARQVAE